MTDSPITDAKAYCQAHREGVLAAVNWAFLLMAGPILCAAIAETLSLSGVAGLEEGFFLLNALIYLFAHLVLYLVVRNTRIACLLVLLVVVGFSIANHYVIAFTGIPHHLRRPYVRRRGHGGCGRVHVYA